MKKILTFLWKYLLLFKKEAIIVMVSMIVAFSVGLIVPLVYKNIIDIASSGIDPVLGARELYHWAFIFLGLIMIQQIGWKILEYFMIPLETSICQKIYEDTLAQMLAQSNRFFTQHFSGSIVRSISRMVDTTEHLIDMFIYQIARMVISIIVMTIILTLENIYLGIGVFVWMMLVIITKRYLWRKKMQFNELVAQKSTKVSARLSDIFSNALTVLTCGMQKEEIRTFKHVVADWKNIWTRAWWMDYGIFFATTIFIVTLQLATIFGSIYLWSQGLITVGTFVLLIVYLSNFIDQAVEVNFLFRNLYKSGADMIEAIDLLHTPREIVDSKNAKKLVIKKGEIIFDHVHFSYHEGAEGVLRDFNLHIRPGEKVAFVGLSGSGKSTVMKLLFRLYDVTRGSITIDGQDISRVTQESLRRSLSMVPQDPILFHRSIAENIAYASDLGRGDTEKSHFTQEEHKKIEKAAKHAFAHDFIQDLPEKYATIVGERGVKLSGGERQRIVLSRAILADKPILIFDEATSALDSISEKFIQESLHEIMQKRTTIVIAHRLSTIMQMDRIIVMDKGKIIEQGSHHELIKKEGGAYKKLWDIQTGEFIVDVS